MCGFGVMWLSVSSFCCFQQCSIRNFVSLVQIWMEIRHKCGMFLRCKGRISFVGSNHWTYGVIGCCNLIWINLTNKTARAPAVSLSGLLELYLFWPTDHKMLNVHRELILFSRTWVIFAFLINIDKLEMVIIIPYSTLDIGPSFFSPVKWWEMAVKHALV